MKKFDVELLDTIQELADYFALEQVQRWARSIKRRKIINTRQLLNSLQGEARKDVGRLVVAMNFAFEEYGRHIDIKGKRWKKQPPVDKILAWVKSKGVDSFGSDPNPYKRKQKTSERRANEIAWGIAKKKVGQPKDKARAWFQSSFYKGLNALQEEIMLGVQDRTIEQMKETLLWRLKKGTSGKYI